ncbi:hypothetical protein ACOSP7_023773 [Xanthoceras sorbifolium]
MFSFNSIGLPILWCDNTGASSLAHNPVFHQRTKHVEVDIHFIREKIASGQLLMQYVPIVSQTADAFTKALVVNQFALLKDKLNLATSLQFSLIGHVKDTND